MKDWHTVTPDVVKLLQKHYTPGRGGRQIRYITRHHLAGIGTTEDVWGWWQTRAASAHYVVENSGRIGQLVWDRDTAWSNANSLSNQESIAIEHSNSGGAGADWPINATVIEEGAKLAAALCKFYKLGRPHFGTNIRDHRQFYATSCPHHLAAGGRYHDQWMHTAGRFYDELTGKTPATTTEGFTVSEADRVIEFIKGYVGPIGSDTKDNRQQLTGGRDAGEYPGWSQLGDRSLVDAVAVIGAELGLAGFHDPRDRK